MNACNMDACLTFPWWFFFLSHSCVNWPPAKKVQEELVPKLLLRNLGLFCKKVFHGGVSLVRTGKLVCFAQKWHLMWWWWVRVAGGRVIDHIWTWQFLVSFGICTCVCHGALCVCDLALQSCLYILFPTRSFGFFFVAESDDSTLLLTSWRWMPMHVDSKNMGSNEAVKDSCLLAFFLVERWWSDPVSATWPCYQAGHGSISKRHWHIQKEGRAVSTLDDNLGEDRISGFHSEAFSRTHRHHKVQNKGS